MDAAAPQVVKEGSGTLELRSDVYFTGMNYAADTTGTLTTALDFNDAATLDARNGPVAGNANFIGTWTGFLTVGSLDVGTWTFGTSSDDGSVVMIDLDNNGDFTSSERIVNNNFFQGDTARTGNATFTSAGTYRIAIAYYQGGGGAAMEARFAKTGSVAYASLTIIDPSAQAGMWTDESGVANRLTERWMSRTPIVQDLDFGTVGTGGGSGLYVNAGTLRLNMQGGSTVNKNIFVGDNDGGSASARVVYASTAAGDQVISGANITVNRSGRLDFAGISDQFNALTIIDGSVVSSTGSPTITVNGGLTMNGGSIASGPAR